MHARFRIIRLLENHLLSSICEIKMVIDIPSTTKPMDSKNRLKAMKLWIETFLDGSVAFSVGNDIDTTTLEHLGNNLMMCPDDPHDYLLLLLVHSKLQAIGGDHVEVHSTSLISDTGEGFSNLIEGTTEEWLPSMEEWIGPLHYHDNPWWNREDSSMMDLKPEPDEDLTKLPPLGIDLISMVSRDLKDAADAPLAEIIKPTFKPKIISADD